jgi:hypothetical protein
MGCLGLEGAHRTIVRLVGEIICKSRWISLWDGARCESSGRCTLSLREVRVGLLRCKLNGARLDGDSSGPTGRRRSLACVPRVLVRLHGLHSPPHGRGPVRGDPDPGLFSAAPPERKAVLPVRLFMASRNEGSYALFFGSFGFCGCVGGSRPQFSSKRGVCGRVFSGGIADCARRTAHEPLRKAAYDV